MTVTEELIRKILELPEPRRRDVLQFVDKLWQDARETSRTRPNRLYGMCSDIQSEITFEEFKQLRREIWGHPEEEWDDGGSAG